MAEKALQEMERIYTIPLREVKTSPRNHRADRAIRHVRAFLTRHMKASEVWIDGAVNEVLWDRGMYMIPSRIRVRAVKFDDGVVEVSLPDAEAKGSLRAEIKARREAAQEGKETKKEGAEKKAETAETKKEPETPAEGETKGKAEAAPEATKPEPEPKKAATADEKPPAKAEPEPKKAATADEKPPAKAEAEPKRAADKTAGEAHHPPKPKADTEEKGGGSPRKASK